MDISDDDPIFGQNTFSLHYRKLNNKDLFSSLEECELGVRNTKNYIPIYENYFNLNETNYNSINLNHRFYVSALSGVVDRNNIEAAVVDIFKSTSNSLTILHKPVFIKFSPLIDPVKYLSGKYENLNIETDVLNIPTLSKLPVQGHQKANDRNNAAYVDGFFSYLSSQVLNCHDFIHGINFYGSFNAIKNDFYYNVIDDLEYLEDNPFFDKNKGVLFDIEDVEYYDDSEEDDENNPAGDDKQKQKHKPAKNTRNKKPKINIDGLPDIKESDNIDICDNFEEISNELNTIFTVCSASSSSTSTGHVEHVEHVEHTDCSSLNLIINDLESLDSVIIDQSNLSDLSVSGVVLNKNSNLIKSNSSEYSYTSSSCSSRSSYTTDGSVSGSDCDIDNTIISLDASPTVENSASKSNKKIKNKKNKSNSSSKSSSSNMLECENENESDNDHKDDDQNGRQSNFSEYEDENEDEDDDEDDDDDTLWATIKNFPVSAIMLEKCDDTLDSLMMQEKEMTENEWRSALMQIIMTLITYQKLFGFTHNDLHTNNVMFIYTEKEYIYYHFNKKYYRVPTYNRAFKIIDFGRAIYKYKSKVICSDSFSSTGDAATQYNCEPYFNDKKPRLEPNFSFDLCRLGCSIFDYFIDDISNVATICKKDPLAKLIVEWVTDDQNRNILYKSNGEERYPDFKLYKMIARNVHNHTPQAQLSKPIFADYEFPKKKVKSGHRIINIDKMPSYME